MPYCPKCGKQVREGDAFCWNCGAGLAREHEDSESVAVEAPEMKGSTTQTESAQTPQVDEAGEQIQEQLKTGLEVKARFFPLGWWFFFCKPIILVDGTAYRTSWGTSFFQLEPGRHTIKIFFHYLFWPECGANSINVLIEEGKISKVRYYMFPWVFMKGSIKTEQPYLAAQVPKGLVAKQVTIPREVSERLPTKRPTIGGILSIIAGAIGLIAGLSSLSAGGSSGWFIALVGIMAIVGGVYAIKRRLWGFALAGAICSLMVFLLGIPAIILIAMSRAEFRKRTEEEPKLRVIDFRSPEERREEEVMAKCAYHPDREAVRACVNCSRLVCDECKTVLRGKTYCNPCAEKMLVAKPQTRESRPDTDIPIVEDTYGQGSLPKVPSTTEGANLITGGWKWRLWGFLGIVFLVTSVVSLIILIVHLDVALGEQSLANSQTVNTLKSLIWWSGLIGGGLMGWATSLRSRSRSSPGVPFQRRFLLLIPGALLFLWSIERLVFGVSPEFYMPQGPFYGFSAVVGALILVVVVASGVFFIVCGLIPVPRGEKR